MYVSSPPLTITDFYENKYFLYFYVNPFIGIVLLSVF